MFEGIVGHIGEKKGYPHPYQFHAEREH